MPNIIQIQDDLKNLPDQVLVNYVQNPTGTMQGIAGYAPSFLVLAELQRRTDMRNRYAAQQQQPEKTVSDKIVEEASPTTMAQNLMGGVNTLPADNIGNNYNQGIAQAPSMPQQAPVKPFAGGGIVAFADGGGLLGPFKKFIKKSKPVSSKPSTSTSVVTQEMAKDISPNIIGRNPYKSLGVAGLGGYYLLSGEDSPTGESTLVDSQGNMLDINALSTGSNLTDNTLKYNPPTFDPKKYKEDAIQKGKDRMKLYKEMIGVDTLTPTLRTKIAAKEAAIAEAKRIAPGMAMMNAGFKWMQSDSPYWMKGLGEAGEVGIKDYTERLKEISKDEDSVFNMTSELEKAKRAEQLAIANKGIDSIEAQEAKNLQLDIKGFDSQLDKVKTQFGGDLEIKKAEIASTLYGHNTKSMTAILSAAKELGLGDQHTVLINLERAYQTNPSEENRQAVENQREVVKNIMQQAESFVMGNRRGSQVQGYTSDGKQIVNGTPQNPVYSTDF